jgi:arginyl-tRNA---protein transferase
VHESEVQKLRPGHEPVHKFEVTLEHDDFTNEKFALFDNYQRHVHHEGDGDISRAGFKRFLCSSPLHRHTTDDGRKLGSYHQCYRLDGRLIAMAVLDLLPHAVSGVYFIYHSDFEKCSFGKLSALREASLALEAGYQYYYMGYYIHGCKKMRYKGEYKPQYVLDYHTGEWDVLDDQMRSVMDRRKYASMSKERQRLQADAGSANMGANGIAKQGSSEEAETDDADIPYPVPAEAAASGLSLLELGMPGVLTLSQLHDTVDLDLMKLSLGKAGIYDMQDIIVWHTGSETDTDSIKGRIAEFAAAVGPEVAASIIVDFSRAV